MSRLHNREIQERVRATLPTHVSGLQPPLQLEGKLVTPLSNVTRDQYLAIQKEWIKMNGVVRNVRPDSVRIPRR